MQKNGEERRSRWLDNKLAHGGCTTWWLTVARWLGGCGRHNGMEEQKNRVGAGDWVHITIIVFRISLKVYSSFTIK